MILGINIKSIRAYIDEKKIPNTEINVNSAPFIENIEKRDEVLGMKNVVAVDFRFETKYEPKIGEIIFEGELLYQSDKDIIKKWKSTKKLDDEIAVEILNAIFRRCLVKAVDISAELKLPPPIRFPLVAKKEDAESQ